ncbi:MAG: 16S rRNA (cytidine(1402)-2'-O)-methyltransferase [Desulfarculaceae bacterium]|nr:16S rRNA (cytidine(1402)-2'-O)-methyltransferase [Desulfarculaceae bacterium]
MNTPDRPQGILYVVATPLGNMEDITYRAVRILTEVDLIAAEDTRRTGKLLSRYDIRNELVSCNEYNEEKRTGFIIEKIGSGKTVALVSDAGTPCVSDPGYVLVKEAVKAGIRVLPIPGCCAVISGLSVSGLPTDSFLFEGFLPKKKGRRGRILENLASEKATLIFYESPHRIVNLVQELIQLMGHRPAALAREMTKLHEEYIRGDLGTLLDELKTRDRIKGECVLFVGAGKEPDPGPASAQELDEVILKHLDEGNGKPSAVSKEIADRLSIPKNDVYQRLVELKRDRK